MKQNIIISIYQILTVALCSYLIIDNWGADIGQLYSMYYIVATCLTLNIVFIILFWKRFAFALRFRIAEAVMLIVSAFTPAVSYYMEIADNEAIIGSTFTLALIYVLGQVVWCASIYIAPELYDKFSEKL